MSQAQSLRPLLSQDRFLMDAGADDVIPTRLVEEARFPLVYCIWRRFCRHARLSAFGMRTLTEMGIRLEGICRAVSAPVSADTRAGLGDAPV